MPVESRPYKIKWGGEEFNMKETSITQKHNFSFSEEAYHTSAIADTEQYNGKPKRKLYVKTIRQVKQNTNGWAQYLVVVCVCVGLGVGLSGCGESNPKTEPQGMNARDLATSRLFLNLENLKEENYDAKIQEATMAITKGNPMNGLMYWSRGMIYALKGDKDMAQQDFIRAWQEDPKQIPILIQALDMYLDWARTANPRSKLVRAFRNFSFELDKTNSQSSKDTTALDHYNRGMEYLLESDNNSAMREFNKAIELNPDISSAYLYRGGVFLKTFQLFEAERDFNKAIELDPKNAQAYLFRGTLLMIKDIDAARRDLKKAVELDPSLAAIVENLEK